MIAFIVKVFIVLVFLALVVIILSILDPPANRVEHVHTIRLEFTKKEEKNLPKKEKKEIIILDEIEYVFNEETGIYEPRGNSIALPERAK